MVLMTLLQGVFWDVDGTLANTEMEGHRPAFNRAFADLDLEIAWGPELYAELLSIPGGMRRVQWYAGSRGMSLSEAQLHAIRDRKRFHYTELARSGAVSLRPGVRRLLEQLNGAGIRQWIVTSSGLASVEALLGSTPDLRPLFQGIVTADDVEEGKPSPQGYLCALQRSQLPMDQTLVIEDSEAGLEAARAAGLRCLLTPSPWDVRLKERFSEAIAVFDHLGDVSAPATQVNGPPCREGMVTLEYLQTFGSNAG
jgi:HAD superfamily hydrolase (TIGR01509 family)